jgi:hypothetical protein
VLRIGGPIISGNRVGSLLLDLIGQAPYSAESYTRLEDYYRAHAEPGLADNVFFQMKKRERERPPFFRRLWSWGLYLLVGYGRRPQYALAFSIIVILFGSLVFRDRRSVVPRKPEDLSQAYNPLWYSFDLLTPFIDLHQADAWMPRQDWRFGCNYAHLHRIIGRILVPIGLAAISGIMK